MLFTKLLLALPFVGVAFAAPAPKVASVATVDKRDIDVLAIVTDLKTSIVCCFPPVSSCPSLS